LGTGAATALVIGNVIGAGIFLKPGEAAAQAGTVPIALAAWVAGGVLCLLGSLTIAELAQRMPQAGGLYLYLREAYGRPVGFLFGWSEFLFGMPASIGALAAGSTLQIGALAKHEFGLWDGAGMAVLLIAGLAAINMAGVVWGGRAQSATTAVKCLFLAALAELPFVLTLAWRPGISPANYGQTVTPSAGSDAILPVRFAGALLAVMWTYNGWHVIAPVAEEVRDPKRTIPRALLVGSIVLTALYLFAVLAYHGALPLADVIAASRAGTLPQTMTDRLLAPLHGGLSAAAVTGITFAALCSMAGSLNASLISGPRVGFAMARDGVFPHPLAAVHPRFRTPAAAIATQAAMSVGLVLLSAVLVANFDRFSKRTIFDILTDYVTFIANIFLLLAVASIFVIRRRSGVPPGYTVPLYPFVPMAYVVAAGLFVAYVFIGRPLDAAAGAALTLAGLPFYWWMTRSR
jgi:APA family basic amino acid/polyamine antiporter